MNWKREGGGREEETQGQTERREEGGTPTGRSQQLHHRGGGLGTHDTEPLQKGSSRKRLLTTVNYKMTGGGRVANTYAGIVTLQRKSSSLRWNNYV